MRSKTSSFQNFRSFGNSQTNLSYFTFF